MKEWRYKLLWSGKGDEVGDVGTMVKKKLCEMVVEVKRASYRGIIIIIIIIIMVIFKCYFSGELIALT